MDETPTPAPVTPDLDQVLRKYGKVWIWSILITASAAMFYREAANLSIVRGFPAQNMLGFPGAQVVRDYAEWVLVIGGLGSVAAAFAALFYLFQFLTGHLLPMFFSPDSTPDPEEGSRLLCRSFAALLWSMGIEVAGFVLILAAKLRG
jgi:hypothetical protein